MHVACRLIASHRNSHFNPTDDCGTPPPPVNGSVQPHTNTTEGSVVVFQCDPGFVPEGVMTAVCGSDGQWTPNPGSVTCSPTPTPTLTQTFTPTGRSTPTRPGEIKHECLNVIFMIGNLLVVFGITFRSE